MNEPNEHDRIIHEAVKNYYDHIEIPDATPSWQKVQVRLQKRRRRKKSLFRLKIVAAVVIASLIIDIAATTNISKTYASMSSLLREVKDSVVEFIFTEEKQEDTSWAKTSPPSETSTTDEPTAIPEETTLEVAVTKLSFPLLLPSYVPKQYSLDVVRIFEEANGQYNNLYLEYVNDSKDIFKIRERLIGSGSSHVRSDISTDAGVIKETMIKSNQGVLVILPEGFVTLEWLTADRIKISISGKLSETEILKLAESLQ